MKTYKLQQTRHPKLFRVVDRKNNWEHYAFVSKFKESYDPEKGDPTFDDLEEVHWLRGATTILGIGYAKDKYFHEWLLSHTREERDQILRAAGDRGDMIHRFIDMVLSYTPPKHKAGTPIQSLWERDIEIHNRETGEERRLTDDEWDCVLAWGAFWVAHAPMLIFSEVSLYNLKYGYAGTADSGLVLTKTCGVKNCPCPRLLWKIGLWDWKSSGAIYPSYAPQTASYAFADNIGLLLPKGKEIEYTAILRVGTQHKNGGYQIEASETKAQMKYDMDRFLASKLIADHDYKPFDPVKDVIEVADKFDVVVAPVDFKAMPKPVIGIDPAKEGADKTVEAVVELPKSSRKAPEKKKPAAKKKKVANKTRPNQGVLL